MVTVALTDTQLRDEVDLSDYFRLGTQGWHPN